jgi:hypothetical protein
MVKRERIQYLNKLIRREETLQIGLPFSVQNELDKSLDDWRYKFSGHLNETIKVFESSYSSIHWYIIKPTNEFVDFTITKEPSHKINLLKESYRLKIPHHFIELDLEFEENNTNQIQWIDTIEDEETLNLSRKEYHNIENPSTKMKQLVVREQMIQLLKEIWEVYKLPATTIKIKHKRVHFVDSSPGIVEKAILEIMSKVLLETPDQIKAAIENKFKSIPYYFTTMNYNSIDVYERNPNSKFKADKLIYTNEYQDPTSRYVGRISSNENKFKQIKEALLINREKKSAIMMAPQYKDALVFRDNKENIEAIFHLCFDTNNIQNEKRIIMETNEIQMKKLNQVLKSSR